MKKPALYLIGIFVPFLILYLLGSFVSVSFDISKWNEGCRLFIALTYPLIAMPVIAALTQDNL